MKQFRQKLPTSSPVPSSPSIKHSGVTQKTEQAKTSELVHLTSARVQMDSSNEGERKKRAEKRKGRKRKGYRCREKVSDKRATRQRKRRRQAREKVQVSSIVQSLSHVRHDSSPLLVLKGMVDGHRCRDVLVDPGASSNFVSRDWALSQGLRVQSLRKPLAITLADGRVLGQQTGAVVVKSMDVQGSFAKCHLIVMDKLSHHIILGMPWLRNANVTVEYGPIIRWNGKPLYRMTTRDDGQPQLQAIKVAPEYEASMQKLLAKYQSAFSRDLPRRRQAVMKDAIHCAVQLKDPNGRPAVSRERRRSPHDTSTLIQAVKEMEAAGLIQKSVSPWSSQPVLVKKVRDGVELKEKRPCWDYRKVNDLIISDAHPLPLPEDMFDKLKGSRLFSKMDLTKGFWQIPMEEASKKILAMATPLGLYEPNFMPFGMKNAPAVFQREMQRVFRDRLYQGVMVFVDDVLIYSETAEQHVELVEWVLRRLQEEGYYAHPDKCEFFQREVSFLGHVVSEKGVAVQQHKVKAIMDWPIPRSKTEVRSFLGVTNYYRKFIAKYSEIAAPLTDLTQNDVEFMWTEREQSAFELLKVKLTTADVLAHPDEKKPYIITTDASGFAISGVLSQDQPDGTRRPISYMSRKMQGAERRYAPHDKELLAIVRAVDHWRCYLEGTEHPILLQSDHKALQHLNQQPNLSDRQARWVEKLCEFDFKIEYVRGVDNKVADRLSRRVDYEDEANAEREKENDIPVHEQQPRVRIQLAAADEAPIHPLWAIRIEDMPLRDDMRAAVSRDVVYQELLNKPEPRTDGLIVGNGFLWTCDGLFYVPNDLELQRRLIYEVHDTPTGGHMGLHKTLARLTSMCWWNGMKSMIADYVKGCITCAATKPSLQKPAGTLRPLPIPEKPWRMISIDFVGPLPRTKDYYDYILVVVDKFSKMAHFIPTTSNVTAKQTAQLLIDHVVRLHGVPDAIISDRGTQFVAQLFQEVWSALGTDLRMSTSYHPQTDGQTERVNRELEQQLRSHANRTQTQWKEWLSVVEMHYNSDRHESTGKTPYEMNGVDWRDALAFAFQKSRRSSMSSEGAQQILEGIRSTWEDARQVMIKQREVQRKYADQSRREEEYEVDDLVMLSTENLTVGRGKLSDRYVGPFRVAEVRENGVNVRLDLPKEFSRIHPVFHVEKLKRFTPSQIDWPGRVQIERPTPVLVDGEEKWWAVKILGKKEEEVEEWIQEIDKEEKVEESKEQLEEKNSNDIGKLDSKIATRSRRISPRDHASTRSLERPVVKPRRRLQKKKPRIVKRLVVKYLVEWEGYGPDDATWEPAESLIADGLQPLIDDYERRQMELNGELSLASMMVYKAKRSPDGGIELSCMYG